MNTEAIEEEQYDVNNYLYKEENNCDDWECEKCKLKTQYIKQTKLWSLPKVLFIVVTRFADIFRKNTEYINILTSIISDTLLD